MDIRGKCHRAGLRVRHAVLVWSGLVPRPVTIKGAVSAWYLPDEVVSMVSFSGKLYVAMKRGVVVGTPQNDGSLTWKPLAIPPADAMD